MLNWFQVDIVKKTLVECKFSIRDIKLQQAKNKLTFWVSTRNQPPPNQESTQHSTSRYLLHSHIKT